MRGTLYTGLLASILFSTGCMVGPNYQRPKVATPQAYRGPDGSQLTSNGSLGDQKWWDVFKDAQLQELIRTALKQNYNVQIAATRVLQAQAQLTITHANQLPNASVGPGVTGVRSPGIPNVFSGYSYLADSLMVSGSWNVDFWGRYRRATEAARASLLATEWGRRAVLSSVVETVATAYFQLREYDLELDIEKRTLESRQHSLQLTQTLEQGGATGLNDVRQAQQLVEEAAAAIPQTEQAIQQTENQISTLLGENPTPISRGLKLTEQPLPEAIPAGIPSQILERRPDVQEAEQNLVAANAQIGVARAQLFPQISLTGDFGVQSIGLGNLFAWGARAWTWSGAATQPIFNGGALRANVRLSQAQEEQALLAYKQTIQTAFQEVSDALIAYQKLRAFEDHQALLTKYAKDASDLAEMRYRGGVTSYLEVLTNETNYFSAELGLARARLGQRLSLVQVYNALGGGWQE
jgi:outer membrane protein, multidrug efflux system